MIDSGTGMREVARKLSEQSNNITVVTNSTEIARAAAANPTFRIVQCPGVFAREMGCVLGQDTLDFIGRYNAHVAFIGAQGISGRRYSMARMSELDAVKQAMMSRAQRVFLVRGMSRRTRTGTRHEEHPPHRGG